MSNLKTFWNPNGFELDSLGSKRHSGPPADGDTPYVRMPIRMLSIDTPETKYPTIGKTSNSDDKLSQLADWIQQGKAPLKDDLAQYLHPKIETGTAGTLQEQQGVSAKNKFQELLDEKLTRPSGTKRNVFLYAADEPFDSHNRLLAYMAPYYSKKELVNISLLDRKTFNLLMAESGWAATLPIYPSLPKHADMVLMQKGTKQAFDTQQGAWADQQMLTGYEWRMCIKLYKVTKKLVQGDSLNTRDRYGWISRYCFDMTTLVIFQPQDYIKVLPYNRIFIWPKDTRRAVAELNLIFGS